MSPDSQLPTTSSLYIHLPFCRQKCLYCDFVSYAGKEELIDEYIKVLCKEIKLLTPDSKLLTIYFGGGTPTLLSPEHFNKIINTLIRHWKLDIKHCEITTEANPGTIDLPMLNALRKLGINRLSLGAQSFNDKHLQTLGRIHNFKQIYQAVEVASAAGFENINLDIMYALPGQTFEEFKADLQAALALKPKHLSVYSLKIEEGTPFWEIFCQPATKLRGFQHTHYEETAKFIRRFPSTINLPDEDTEASMFEYTIDTLEAAGYHHYEISNFAKPGFECQHNINYWQNGNYLGVGAGAHSHVNGKRWANPNCIEEYMRLASGGCEVSNELRDALHVTPNEPHPATAQCETLFLGLRMLEGLPKVKFTGFDNEVGELIKDELLEELNGNYKLTRRGLFLGNLVFEKFV